MSASRSLNDASSLQVVTPLSGTPAARAGIRAGDIIRKIDGFDAGDHARRRSTRSPGQTHTCHTLNRA